MTDEEILLKALPEDGTGIGNIKLRRLLGWTEEKYSEVRERLFVRRSLVKGPGHGGSVKRADAAEAEQLLRDAVEALGGSSGNKKLRSELDWDQEHYFAVRDRLIDQGVLLPGRGQGGSVRFAEDIKAKECEAEIDQITAEQQRDEERIREDHLYDPMAKVLENDWSRDKRFKWKEVEITARQGSRATGGRWTRPDITVISLRRYKYVPGLDLDVWTFEVKTADSIDVRAVYEAVAHTRFATRSTVIFPWNMGKASEADRERLETVRAEAERHGIGVIVVGDLENYETWEELVLPSRTTAEPWRTNEFISQQIRAQTKSDLQDQLR